MQRRLTLARSKAERHAADVEERQRRRQREYREQRRIYLSFGPEPEVRPFMTAQTAMERVRNFLNQYLYHLMTNTPQPPVVTAKGPRGWYWMRLKEALTTATGTWDLHDPTYVDDFVLDFLNAASGLGHELNAAPLPAPTWHQGRPTLRDLHDEVTAAIMALPDRTARGNLKLNDRAQVRTFTTRDLGPPPVEPEAVEAHLEARRRAIFTRMTQAGLLRPRAAVEAEIAARQAEDEEVVESGEPMGLSQRQSAAPDAPDTTRRGPRPAKRRSGRTTPTPPADAHQQPRPAWEPLPEDEPR